MQIDGYDKGELRMYRPQRSDECRTSEAFPCECGDYHSYEFEGKAFLPHSCSEWIIGDADQVQALIEDLQEALRQMTATDLSQRSDTQL
jgi:hypothetical protein